MSILFRFRPRKGMGIDPALDRRCNGPEIRIGRASDNDLVLRDAALGFHHALITLDGTGIRIRAVEGARLQVDAREAEAAALEVVGDGVRLGSYSLTLAPPDAEGPVVVFEPGAGGAESAAAITAGYLASLELPRVRVGRWSWGLALAVLMLGFAIPLAATLLPSGRGLVAAAPAAVRPSVFWEVGTMSSAHGGFGTDCRACHETPFVPVRASACRACHLGTGQHADPHLVPSLDLARTRCESCHREHKGTVQAIREDQSFCVSCHNAIKRQFPQSALLDVTDFGRDHPEFAPSLVTDAGTGATTRIRLGEPGPWPDRSNLRFPHAKHLVAAGVKGPDGTRILHCQDCHRPDSSGAQMQPIVMERDCLACHRLQFEPSHPEWRLPHGKPEEVASRLLGFYSSAVLAGEHFGPVKDALFTRPGEPPEPAELPEAAARTAAAAAMASSVARATCGQCHGTLPPAPGADPLAWTVLPVRVPASFLHLARFDHAKHGSVACRTCHVAETSNGGPEALLPGIATCRQCHAGSSGEGQKIASPCVSCHVYHRPDLPVSAEAGGL
jgi:predicted CXXCH cytochrome family protein